jgi:hypothetical protein
MTDNAKAELDDLYYEFRRDLHKLAIKNRIGPHLYFAHIVHSRKARAGTGTSWNNFQHYDPEAKRLFAECEFSSFIVLLILQLLIHNQLFFFLYIVGKDEGGDRVSKLWAEKDVASKMWYRDIDYVTGLSQSNGEQIDSAAQDERHAPTNANQVSTANSCGSVAKIPQKETLASITSWALKVEAEVRTDFLLLFIQTLIRDLTFSLHS